MPRYAPTPIDVRREIRARFAAGEPAKSIADELEMSESNVHAFTCHLPQGAGKRERDRLAILTCLDAGLDVRSTAERVGTSIGRVVRIVRAWRSEREDA